MSIENKKILIAAGLVAAATAGSVAAAEIIRRRRQAERQKPQSHEAQRIGTEDLIGQQLSIRERLAVNAKGIPGLVNQFLKAGDPIEAARLIDGGRTLKPSEVGFLVRSVTESPHLPISKRVSLALAQDSGDFVYRLEQGYRAKLRGKDYSAEVLTEKTGPAVWKKVGTIIDSQWRFPQLAASRHGIRLEEMPYVGQQFGASFLETKGNNKPEVQFLAIGKKGEVVGYISFLITNAALFQGTDLSQLTLKQIKEAARDPLDDKAMVFLSATAMKDFDFSEVVATGFYAGGDFAKRQGIREVYLPSLSAYAFARQKQKEAGTYFEFVNARSEGKIVDEWRDRQTLFADPVLDQNGQVIVSENFAVGSVSRAEFIGLLTPRELKQTLNGNSLSRLQKQNGLFYLKNSHVPFGEMADGSFSFQVPAFWMKLRVQEENPSLGSFATILG